MIILRCALAKDHTRIILLGVMFSFLFPAITFPKDSSVKSDATLNAKTSFSAVMHKVKEVQRTGNLEQIDSLKPMVLHYIDAVVTTVRNASKSSSVSIPVKAEDLTPTRTFPLRRIKDAITIVDNYNFRDITNSIVLATGIVHVDRAKNSIIIANGAVYAGFTSNSIIIGGHYVESGHEGSANREKLHNDINAKITNRSLLVSGSTIFVAFAGATVCYAPNYVWVAHAQRVILLGAPETYFAHEKATNRFALKEGVLVPTQKELSLTRIEPVSFDTSKQTFTFKHSGNQHVLRTGQPFPAEVLNGIQHLRDWKLSLVGTEYVLLVNSKGEFSGWPVGVIKRCEIRNPE